MLIGMLSTPEESHFVHNLSGVVIGAFVVFYTLGKLRNHPFLKEVVYVWDLKQNLNKIYRKQRKIEAAVENGNKNAMIVMNFQYRGSKQLYELDDNLVTMTELLEKIRVHDERLNAAGIGESTDLYRPSMLDEF